MVLVSLPIGRLQAEGGVSNKKESRVLKISRQRLPFLARHDFISLGLEGNRLITV